MQTGELHTPPHRWATAPLVTAFLLIPAGFLAAKLSTVPISPEMLHRAHMGIWLCLSGLATIACLRQSAARLPAARSLPLSSLAGTTFTVMAGGLFLWATPMVRSLDALFPYFYEFQPLVFLLFACAWAATFGLPERPAILRMASWLGAMVVFDAVQALVRQTPERLLGSSDVLATLLLVGLCAGLPSGRESGEGQASSARRAWIMLGLLATLSRTGLFAAAWVYAFFGPGSGWRRLPYVCLCTAAVAASFMLEAHFGLGSLRFMEYWIWLECLERLTGPARLFTGFALNAPVGIVPPLDLMGLWEILFSTPATDGLRIQQIPAFWVRNVMAWGILPSLAFLASLLGLLIRTPTRFGAGLTAVCIAQGISTDLFYTPGPAIILFLALFLAFRPEKQ